MEPELQNPISALFSHVMSLTLHCERSAETGRYNYLFHRLRCGFETQVNNTQLVRILYSLRVSAVKGCFSRGIIK